jgi:hypothetical protein
LLLHPCEYAPSSTVLDVSSAMVAVFSLFYEMC